MTLGAVWPNRQPDVVHALASMQTGELTECDATGPDRERLLDLAAMIPSLFGAHDLSTMERVVARLGGEGGAALREILFLSSDHVHVVRPLFTGKGLALLATSPVSTSVGLVLSMVHARAAELEGG